MMQSKKNWLFTFYSITNAVARSVRLLMIIIMSVCVCNNHPFLCLWTRAIWITFQRFYSGSLRFLFFLLFFSFVCRLDGSAFKIIRSENIFFGVHFWHCTPKAEICVIRVRWNLFTIFGTWKSWEKVSKECTPKGHIGMQIESNTNKLHRINGNLLT